MLGIVANIMVAWWLAIRTAQIYSISVSPSVNIRSEGQPTYVSSFQTTVSYRPGLHVLSIGRLGSQRDPFDHEIARRIAVRLAADDQQRNVAWMMGAGNIVMPRPVWPSWMPLPPDDDSKYEFWEGRATGWPMLSLSSLVYVPAGELLPRASFQIPAQPKSGTVSGSRQINFLPMRPIPLGFTVNSLLFAIPFTIPPILAALYRRRNRFRAGHCKSCGYSLAGLPPNTPCPECNSSPPN